MVRRKASRTEKGTNISHNKEEDKNFRKVTATRPNKKIQRSVKKPATDPSRFRKAVRNSNIKSKRSERIHKLGE